MKNMTPSTLLLPPHSLVLEHIQHFPLKLPSFHHQRYCRNYRYLLNVNTAEYCGAVLSYTWTSQLRPRSVFVPGYGFFIQKENKPPSQPLRMHQRICPYVQMSWGLFFVFLLLSFYRLESLWQLAVKASAACLLGARGTINDQTQSTVLISALSNLLEHNAESQRVNNIMPASNRSAAQSFWMMQAAPPVLRSRQPCLLNPQINCLSEAIYTNVRMT